MGIYYEPVLGFGVMLGETEEVEEFLNIPDDFTEDSGVEEFEHSSGVDIVCLNYYTGYGYFVGYLLHVRDPEKFAENVLEASCKWEENFKGVEGVLVHTVQVC